MPKFLIILISCFLVSCTNNDGVEIDTTTSGVISISADESLKPLIEAEKMVFESLYPKAKLNITYTSELEAIKLMLQDSCRMTIVTRKLSENEKKPLIERQINPQQIKMATDGLAFIINKSNPDSVFSLNEIRKLFEGTAVQWNQIFSKSKLGKLQVVFDNPMSGAIRFIKDTITKNKDLPNYCFAVNSNKEVIDYVEHNKNAIGIIGLSWISDEDDAEMQGFLNRITVAEIIPDSIIRKSLNYKPILANLALKQYPFCREVFMISREAKTGLGTGFASFVASDQGQRIISKAGLLPAKTTIRIIEITH